MRLRGRGPGRRGSLLDQAVTLDFDATLVDVHTDDKEGAEPTYKEGCGFHLCSSTATRPMKPSPASSGRGLRGPTRGRPHRPAGASSQPTAGPDGARRPEDGVEVLVRAVRRARPRLPQRHRGKRLLLLDRLRRHRGRAPGHHRRTGGRLGGPHDLDMEDREGAGVAEVTAYLDLSAWPAGTRAICRREEPMWRQFNLFDPRAGATRSS